MSVHATNFNCVTINVDKFSIAVLQPVVSNVTGFPVWVEIFPGSASSLNIISLLGLMPLVNSYLFPLLRYFQ